MPRFLHPGYAEMRYDCNEDIVNHDAALEAEVANKQGHRIPGKYTL
jgi:hypothetical protein